MAEKKYKQREQKPRVSVATVPNGYALTIDGMEYLCFTAEQLVSEVFVRLALGELEYMNKETISAVLEAAARWQDAKDALMANAELIAQARRAQSEANIALRAQAKANERAEALQKERDRLWNENVNLGMEKDLLTAKLKKFDKMLVGGSKPIKVTSETKLTKGQREAHKRKKQ
jgi:glycyl-tRNA synthetase alpha subunit